MKTHLRPVLELSGRTPEVIENDIDHSSGSKRILRGENIAALKLLFFNALQIDGRSQPGAHLVHFLVVHLDPPDSRIQTLGINSDFIGCPDLTGHGGPCDDSAKAFHREHPVHREAEKPAHLPLRDLFDQAVKHPYQLLDSLSCHRRNRNNRCVFEKRAGQESRHVFLHEFKPLLIHHVYFGQNNKPLFHPQELADLQMLSRLGHHAFVRGDHESHKIHAGRTGHHVFHEFLMARYVDDSQDLTARQFEVGKSELYGDASLLLLFEPIRVYAGHGLDERGLPVIDVACGSKNNLLHCLT